MDVHAAAFGEVQPQGPAANPYATSPYSNTVPSKEENMGGYTGHGGKSFSSAKKDIFDWFFSYVNRSLLIFKLFYFFFFGAFGSLFPLISVYFKQLGLSGCQTGILNGVRALVECFGAPFWSHVAEKWKKGKEILVGSICCWILFTLAIGFVKPSPVACLMRIPDGNSLALERPYEVAVIDTQIQSAEMSERMASHTQASKRYTGQSPLPLDVSNLLRPEQIPKNWKSSGYGLGPITFIDGYNYTNGSLVMPLYSTVVYSKTKINQCFGILILLILLGEIFACPTVCIADSAVLLYLEGLYTLACTPFFVIIEHPIKFGEVNDSYGRQRMFGSVGWGITMFLIGLILDYSTTFPGHPCKDPGHREKNYMVCFTVFTVLMLSTLVVSTQFNFGYEGSQESMYFKMVKDKFSRTFLGRQTKSRGKFENEEYDETGTQQQEEQKKVMTNEDILEKQLGVKFAARKQPDLNTDPNKSSNPYTDELAATTQLKVTKWATVFRHFGTPKLGIFLFVVWFMGLGMGIVFTFLFWHMQEFKGSPTIFGIASVINHISEIAAYYFSKPLLEKIGHINMLYAGLLANVARFLWVSWIHDPWWILPFEFLQGLTHAGVWAACCSYVAQSFPSDLRLSTQGFLQGVHHGLGRGMGAIFGGIVVSSYGTPTMFRAYGAASGVVFLVFLTAEVMISRKEQVVATQAETGVVDTTGQFIAQPVIGGSEYYESSVGYTMPQTGGYQGVNPPSYGQNYGGYQPGVQIQGYTNEYNNSQYGGYSSQGPIRPQQSIVRL